MATGFSFRETHNAVPIGDAHRRDVSSRAVPSKLMPLVSLTIFSESSCCEGKLRQVQNRNAMKVLRSVASIFALAFAACSPYASSSDVPRSFGGTMQVRSASGFHVLYSFDPSSGKNPQATLTLLNGVLYGTTLGSSFGYFGTVFSITTDGTYAVIYDFGAANSYFNPIAPTGRLTVVGRTLYGTTEMGGSEGSSSYSGDGTVFSVTVGGKETVLHSFPENSSDGAGPFGGVVFLKGTLYGTTLTDGHNGRGIVFGMTPNGKAYRVIHDFPNSPSDGQTPASGLIVVNGTLYGTTLAGGVHGLGTVFSITTGGVEKVLHAFPASRSDGAAPLASLTTMGGTFYGTTSEGGAYHRGTVFSVAPNGKYRVLHSFGANGSDGAEPAAELLALNGTLFGTTPQGGINGLGTVFSVTTSGKEKVLHAFSGGRSDGARPFAGLVNVNGVLFSTTKKGGAQGVGTVFTLAP